MSYVMLEGAAAGKPILCTAFGGATTVVESGRNGRIIANDGDVAKLADAMIHCAEPLNHAILSQEAKRQASRFSLDAMLNLTEAVYLRLAGRMAPAPRDEIPVGATTSSVRQSQTAA